MKGLHSFKRNGRWYHYLRSRGKRIPLVHGVEPDDPRLMQAWSAKAVGKRPPRAGTVAQGFQAYMESRAFADLAAATRSNRGSILRRLIKEQGDRKLSSIEPRHITAALSRLAPSSARTNRAHLSAAFRYLVTLGMMEADPAAAAEVAKARPSPGHPAWTAKDIERFQGRWPRGTTQRLAFDLALLTGQRRGDLCRMGRQMVRGGVLSLVQEKTGAEAHVPVGHELRAAVEPFRDRMVWVLNRYGEPFDAPGLGRWFRKQADAAGVGKSIHGLRKTFCALKAEEGYSTLEIQAMSGHRTLKEIAHYTEGADRRRMVEAMAESEKVANADCDLATRGGK
ncbi:MAG: tyrosine-type recombinase/integrase [Pseudomonadota bacterium]